ncbi:hypothetical protein LX32DRAFT_182125 [Colletotrichum zoysiae]|uniref:Uncharacterized protein n=1 Tax=Colletotrichum zoysiae TaxID=1216348 RepID=A0AAD9HRG4_9PEZI|nr:hypothetical protein LX32DRAFT_182125 [Colletotrichum zoysiae]
MCHRGFGDRRLGLPYGVFYFYGSVVENVGNDIKKVIDTIFDDIRATTGKGKVHNGIHQLFKPSTFARFRSGPVHGRGDALHRPGLSRCSRHGVCRVFVRMVELSIFLNGVSLFSLVLGNSTRQAGQR